MTDFFSRLAERALGIALTIQPMVAPMYAPEPQQVEDDLLEVLVDETLEAQTSAPVPARHVSSTVNHPETRYIQLSTVLPEMQYSQTLPSSNSITKPTHASAMHFPSDPLLAPQEGTQRILQPYPVIQREVLSHGIIAEQSINNTSVTTTQHIQQSHTHTINSAIQQNAAPPITHTNIEQQYEYVEIHAPPLPNQSTQHPSAAVAKRATPLSNRHTIPNTPGNGTSNNESTTRMKNGQYAHNIQTTHTIKEAPSSPTIQVTIGRIEVRATTTPTPNAQPQRQQVTPPVMSLDDYLNQRAKGGR